MHVELPVPRTVARLALLVQGPSLSRWPPIALKPSFKHESFTLPVKTSIQSPRPDHLPDGPTVWPLRYASPHQLHYSWRHGLFRCLVRRGPDLGPGTDFGSLSISLPCLP